MQHEPLYPLKLHPPVRKAPALFQAFHLSLSFQDHLWNNIVVL